VIGLSCKLVSDQSAMAAGSLMQRKKVARLWPARVASHADFIKASGQLHRINRSDK
jgi:hypothetical protein